MTKPITPKEAENKVIPDFVIDCFNELIRVNMQHGSAVVRQSEIIALIKSRMPENATFLWGWLDIEKQYGEYGWTVDYDKPVYCETYPATFTFKKKPKFNKRKTNET